MNSSWIEPPPPQGMGCFAKGCLIVVAFFVFLGVAFVGGTFLAVRYLRTSYFATSQAQVPAITATAEEQQAARAKWDAFKDAARSHQSRQIELTADEINALIASEHHLRGKAYVRLENDKAHLQVSVPLDQFRMLRGRYMNAECTVESPPDGDPRNVTFPSIVVNGKSVGEDVLKWRGPWGFRHYLNEWGDAGDIKRFEIKDGKVFLESRGSD